jgi:hypothetical protein
MPKKQRTEEDGEEDVVGSGKGIEDTMRETRLVSEQ